MHREQSQVGCGSPAAPALLAGRAISSFHAASATENKSMNGVNEVGCGGGERSGEPTPTLDVDAQLATDPFWETDLDLRRAQVVLDGRPFVPPPRPHVRPPAAEVALPTPQLRPQLILPLVAITVVAVLTLVRWPATARPSLVICLCLAVFVILSAVIQRARTLHQHRENQALRTALAASQDAQKQLRFQQLQSSTRAA